MGALTWRLFNDPGVGAEPTPSAVSTGSPRRLELKLVLGGGMTLVLVRG